MVYCIILYIYIYIYDDENALDNKAFVPIAKKVCGILVGMIRLRSGCLIVRAIHTNVASRSGCAGKEDAHTNERIVGHIKCVF